MGCLAQIRCPPTEGRFQREQGLSPDGALRGQPPRRAPGGASEAWSPQFEAAPASPPSSKLSAKSLRRAGFFDALHRQSGAPPLDPELDVGVGEAPAIGGEDPRKVKLAPRAEGQRYVPLGRVGPGVVCRELRAVAARVARLDSQRGAGDRQDRDPVCEREEFREIPAISRVLNA